MLIPLILVLTLAGMPAWAQGGIGQTTAADPQNNAQQVDVGAGTTSATTTGSSGPAKKQAGAKPQGQPPQQNTASSQPMTFQCARIDDPTAREMCESRARKLHSPEDLLAREHR